MSANMGELPRNVREFIVRDLIYIAGGGVVLVSFLCRFDRLPSTETPLAFNLLGAALAYAIGNALQDVFSILRLVTTAHVRRLGPLGKWFYRRFYVRKWKDIKKFDVTQSEQAFRELQKMSRRYAASYERGISGLILASAMAPCTLIGCLLVASRRRAWHDSFDFWLSVMSLLLSLGLFAFARLRAAEVTRTDALAPENRDALRSSLTA